MGVPRSRQRALFEKPTAGREDRYGLWLDVRVESDDCPPDPFENEEKYPGVRIGARGKNIPVGSYYGYASGIVACGSFRTLSSTRRRRGSGTLSATTPILDTLIERVG